MAKKTLIAPVLGALAAIAAVSAANAGPAVATRWQKASIPQEDCLRRAEGAIAAAGFGRLERTEQSRYGTRDDYTAAVRCVTENGIVFIIVSGPSRQIADGLSGTVFQHYSAENK